MEPPPRHAETVSYTAIPTGHKPATTPTPLEARPFVGTEYVSPAGAPNRTDYDMMTVPPADVEPGDLCFHHGLYRTISQRLALAEGDTAVYFTDHPYTTGNRMVLRGDVLGVTVYRPKEKGL